MKTIKITVYYQSSRGTYEQHCSDSLQKNKEMDDDRVGQR